MVTVHLLRHGEVHNPDGVLYGRLPGFRLSELGERQAAGRGRRSWPGRDIGYLVSSPLERAQQTAAPLAAATGLDVAVDERLIEADNSSRDAGSPAGKNLFRDPRNWKYFGNPLRPSWGEPYAEIADAGAGRRAAPPRDARRRRARRCASATSCRSSSARRAPRASGCCTTRASGSARSPR